MTISKTILSGPIGRALTRAEAATENCEWFKEYWPKTKPVEHKLVDNLRDYWNWEEIQRLPRYTHPRHEGKLIMELHCYRFWYRGEVFYIHHSQMRINWTGFTEWVWLVVLEVREARFLSPNSHEFFVYNGSGLTDIYFERSYGDTNSI